MPLLTEQCPLGVSAKEVRQAVSACRFERMSHGRARGEEDIGSHLRKGVAGDWRNYFTDKLKQEFKLRYGNLLLATGYEQNPDW